VKEYLTIKIKIHVIDVGRGKIYLFYVVHQMIWFPPQTW